MNKNDIRILLCEDEENLGNIVLELLENQGYTVDRATDGQAGWEYFLRTSYDLCLLDVMMPTKDGLSLAKDIRKINQAVPIIFLTAMGMRDNVLEGFHAGADDYITKPFSMEEVLLRIEAILRRTGKLGRDISKVQEVYHIGKFVFNTAAQTLTYGEDNVQRMTTKETELLTLLCQFSNATLERQHALSVIWGVNEPPQPDSEHAFTQRSMDVYVTKLRRMLSLDPDVEIKNVHGKGYKLVVPAPQRRL